MTNGDKIRQMNNKELAREIFRWHEVLFGTEFRFEEDIEKFLNEDVISDREYGHEKCPLDDDELCFDFDRLGTIACRLCGANKELAEQGQENFWSGIEQSFKNK